MKNKLVFIQGSGKNAQPLTTSEIVAKKLNVAHKKIVDNINKAIVHLKTRNKLKGSTSGPLNSCDYYIDKYNTSYRKQEFIAYKMNKKFFTFLVMRLKSNKAIDLQVELTDKFFEMEKHILMVEVNKQNFQWLETRENSIEHRKLFTDKLKPFIEYCELHGSKNSKRYYQTITNLLYKKCDIDNDISKDSFEDEKLLQLMDMEDKAIEIITDGINKYVDYHDIYQNIKSH